MPLTCIAAPIESQPAHQAHRMRLRARLCSGEGGQTPTAPTDKHNNGKYFAPSSRPPSQTQHWAPALEDEEELNTNATGIYKGAL